MVSYPRRLGQVMLRDRKLEVDPPCLCNKGLRSLGVEVRAYCAMQNRETLVLRMPEAEVEALPSRSLDDLKLLVIYIDGLVLGDYAIIGALGVDFEGNKHVLRIRERCTENSTEITELLEDIVVRGVDPKRRMRMVIDGSTTRRVAINAVFGRE